MFGLHRHQFVEVERFYEPAIQFTTFSGSVSPRAAKQLCSGTTTIHSQCTICSKDRFKEVYGKSTVTTEVPLGDETITKLAQAIMDVPVGKS